MNVGIRKRKKKKGYSYVVYIEYKGLNGSRPRETLEIFENKKDAENYQAEIKTQITNNTFIRVPNITFSEAIDEWMENYVKNECEPNTADSYISVNNNYLKPILGHIPFKIISSPSGIDIINDYYKYLRFELQNEFKIDKRTKKKIPKRNLSYSSIEHHKAQISGIFTYFVKNKKLENNICINTTIPKNEDERMKDTIIDDIENFEDDELYEEKDSLTPEQAITLLNLFINTDIILPVAFGMFLGLRRSESLGILKNKLDKDNYRLYINAVRVRCGNNTIYKKRNKNKTSTRILYIPKILMKIIEINEKQQELNKKVYGDNYIDSKFLCVMSNGQPIKPNYVSATFKKVFERFISKEKEKNPDFEFPYVTLHSLRHLNITSLLENGAVMVDVQTNAGHSNIDTTMHYTHPYIEGKLEIANKTDEIYSNYLSKIGS